jgi:hypothetical protein
MMSGMGQKKNLRVVSVCEAFSRVNKFIPRPITIESRDITLVLLERHCPRLTNMDHVRPVHLHPWTIAPNSFHSVSPVRMWFVDVVLPYLFLKNFQ